MPTVAILGGSYAGLFVAHSLLKNTKAKVIVVSKNSHFYWNLASVRAVIPGSFSDDQLFFPLQDALSRYPTDRYELVVGTVTAVDPTNKSFVVHDNQTYPYDHLVVATGARCAPLPDAIAAGAPTSPHLPWKAEGTFEEIRASLKSVQERVRQAETIVVAGGGTTGVETAGELACEKKKKVVLLSRDKRLLGGDATVAKPAEDELRKLGVDVRLGVGVEATKQQEGEQNKTILTLTDGTQLTTDLYLPALGLAPNSEFLPAALRNEKGYVDVDEFYRIPGAADLWAVGDIVSKPRAGSLIAQKQAAGVARNIALALEDGKNKKAPQPVQLMPVDVLAVTVGRSRGTGRINRFRMPSLMVWFVKGRKLGTNYMASYKDGSIA